MTSKEIAQKLCQALDDKKGRRIVQLYVEHMTILTDYFIIVSGRSVPQVQALSDAVEDAAAEMGLPVRRSAGYQEGRWIVQDFGSVVVHIFHEQERDFYDLERLWMDGSNAEWLDDERDTLTAE